MDELILGSIISLAIAGFFFWVVLGKHIELGMLKLLVAIVLMLSAATVAILATVMGTYKAL